MKHCSIIISHYGLFDDFGTEHKGISRSAIMRQCLESLKETTDYPAEIIVVDNGGSPDDSEYLIQKVREGLINTLIRNKENMGFAYAWNQGVRLATGEYLCFTCNDILFKKGWLSSCINLLEKYSDKKFIVAPFISKDKDNASCNKGFMDGNRINSMAGSNCMLMTYDIYYKSAEFPHHRVGGSIWQRRMIRTGYLVVVPPVNMAEHIAEGKGVNFVKQFYVNKTLLDGTKINFNYTYENAHKDYYYGSERISGCPLNSTMPEGRVVCYRDRQKTDTVKPLST